MIGAASVASIPYVGAALALAAMGSIYAAGQPIIAASSVMGAFADGGRPPVGMVSLVGERGPELFVPDTAGTIIPSEKSAQMLSGGNGSGSQFASSGDGSGSGKFTHKTVIVYDRQELLNELKSGDAEKITVAHVFKNKRNLGMNT